jgi:hypothetical protein
VQDLHIWLSGRLGCGAPIVAAAADTAGRYDAPVVRCDGGGASKAHAG